MAQTIATNDDDHISDMVVQTRRMSMPYLATFVVVVGIVFLARDVLLPLSIAMLITFALSPLATRLRKLGLPHLVSVLVVVAIAFTAIGLFVLMVTSQLGTLAQNLPSFQANIIAKVEGLRAAGRGNGLISQMVDMISAINTEIGAAVPVAASSTVVIPDAPMPVKLVDDQSPFALLQDLVLPLISPIAMVGLVIVVVIFMLLEREDLRDRFIKLVGSNDLHRTTQVLEEAGHRVGQYLLVQLLVNVIYAVPIGVGLWLIGVPNAMLWGLLTLVLRFVPYIGTILAAAFPIFLAFAVSPDWSAVLWTIALFGTVELLTSNVVEPYLYGSRTGVSPLAVIVAAIFWTWIWGPFGLVLSTPLTVCLVVLGRHIPQFAVFNTLFGDEPVLAPHARLYQRLLVGDALEATLRAEEALEVQFISEYYRDVGIPALLIAQNDHARGVLTVDQQRRLADVAQAMVADLAPVVNEELAEMQETVGDAAQAAGVHVICIGGRNELDDAAAAMVTQTLAAEGALAEARLHADLSPARFRALPMADVACVVLTFLEPHPSRASLLHVRRIKLAAPHLRVGVLICDMPQGDGLGQQGRQVDDTVLAEALAIGADFAVKGLDEAVRGVFAAAQAKPLPPVVREARTRGPRLVPQAVPA